MINTISCTPSEALEVIETYWDLGYAIYLHGQPGVGKSQLVEQLGKKKRARLYDARLSQKTAADIGGLPALDHQTQRTTFYIPDFLPREEGPSILFFDEMNHADDQTKGAAYGIILERRVGTYTLPKQCRVIAAGNRLEDGAIGSDLGSALSDRFVQIVIEPSATDWLAWATENGIAKEVMAFIHVHPQFLTPTPEMIEQGHTVVPTPRSWERVSNVMKVAARKRVREIAIAGIIGDAVAAQFFLTADELATMASVEKILATPLEQLDRVIPTTISGLYALSYALTAAVDAKNGGKILDVIWELKNLHSQEHLGLPLADVQAFTATQVINRMLKLGLDCTEHPAFIAYDQEREAESVKAA